MAGPVNPAVSPTQDPNYWHWSKAIEQPKSDESSAYAIKGAAETLGEGIKLGDEVLKDYIKTGVQADLDPIVKERTDQLGATLDVLKDKGGSKIAEMGAQEVPRDVKAIEPVLSTLNEARANGRLSQTDYIAKRDSVLKDWRSRFQGYRDYIDAVGEKVTGIPTANALIHSRIEDINSFVQNANKEKDKLNSEVYSHMNVLGPALVHGYFSGQIDAATIRIKMAERLASHYDLEERNLQRTTMLGDRDALAKTTKDLFTDTANAMVHQSMDDVTTIAGLGTRKFSEFMDDINSGKIKPTPDQARALASVYTGHMQIVDKQLDAVLNAPRQMKDKDGKVTSQSTWMVDMGGNEHANPLKQASMDMYGRFVKSITDEHYGAAFSDQNYIKDRAGSAARYLLDNRDIGTDLALKSAIDKMMPNFAKDWFQLEVGHGLQGKWLAVQKAYATDYANPTSTVAPGAKATTTEQLTHARDNGAPQPIYETILKLPVYITRLDLPEDARHAMANRTFDHAGSQIFTNFNFETDGKDAQGRFRPGKYSIYQTYTSQTMAHQINLLSEHDPALRRNYLEFNATSFGTLFRQNIANLSELPDKNVKLEFDEKNMQFIPHFGDEGTKDAAKYARTGYRTRITDSIDNLNRALRGQANVLNEFKIANPAEKLLEHMEVAGFNPTKVTGLPAQIVKRIQEAKAESESVEKAYKKN